MERQSKEESLVLWTLEKDHFSSKPDTSKELLELIEVVDEKINDYTLTYNEFVDDIIDGLKNCNDTNDLNERKQQVLSMYSYLIKKYKENGEHQ